MDKILKNNNNLNQLNINTDNAKLIRNRVCFESKGNKVAKDKGIELKNIPHNRNNCNGRINETQIKDSPRKRLQNKSYKDIKDKIQHRHQFRTSSSPSYNSSKLIDNSLQLKEKDEKKTETSKLSHSKSMKPFAIKNPKEKKPNCLRQNVRNRLIKQVRDLKQKKKELKEKYYQNICVSQSNTEAKRDTTIYSIIENIKGKCNNNSSHQRKHKSNESNKSDSQVKKTEKKELGNNMNTIIESRKKLSNYYYQKEEIKNNKSFTFNKNNYINQDINEKKGNQCKTIMTLNNQACSQKPVNTHFIEGSDTPLGGKEIKENKPILGSNNYHHNQSFHDSTASNQSQKYNFDYNVFSKFSQKQYQKPSPSFQCIHNDKVRDCHYNVSNQKDEKQHLRHQTNNNYANKYFEEESSQLREDKKGRLNDLEQIKLLSYSALDRKVNQYCPGINTNSVIQYQHLSPLNDIFVTGCQYNHNNHHCCNQASKYCFYNDHISCNSIHQSCNYN